MCVKLHDTMQDFVLKEWFLSSCGKARQGSRLFTATVYQVPAPCWALTYKVYCLC